MTDERRDAAAAAGDRLEEALDDLRRALAIEPSPGFAARVRARANDDRARGWRWRGSRVWLIALVPTAAALVLALQLLPNQTPAAPVRPVAVTPVAPELSSTAARTPLPSDATPLPRGATPEPAVAPPARARRSVAQPNRTPARAVMTAAAATPRREPEVIIPDDQRLALIRLLDAARAGRVVLGPGASASELAGELPPPVPLDVQPIVIPLLPGTPDPADGSGRQ